MNYLILFHKARVMFNCLDLVPPSFPSFLNHSPPDIQTISIFLLSIKIIATNILVCASLCAHGTFSLASIRGIFSSISMWNCWGKEFARLGLV